MCHSFRHGMAASLGNPSVYGCAGLKQPYIRTAIDRCPGIHPCASALRLRMACSVSLTFRMDSAVSLRYRLTMHVSIRP